MLVPFAGRPSIQCGMVFRAVPLVVLEGGSPASSAALRARWYRDDKSSGGLPQDVPPGARPTQVPVMCSGRIGTRRSGFRVASRTAAATAGPEEIVGGSPTPRTP